MIFTIEKARDILRIDGSDNDAIIEPLLQAIPPYLEATTGYTAAAGEFSPVARAAGRFFTAAMVLRRKRGRGQAATGD